MNARTFRFVSILIVGACFVGAAALAQSDRPQQPARPAQPDLSAQLIQGLRSTPGCLGVDAGRWQSGKSTIVGWFENKEAVVRWYYTEGHQGVMDSLTADGSGSKPLAQVADDTGPIMVMASLVFTDEPKFEGLDLPVSQISIELFQPLPGGAFLGERLAPEAFKVPHMRDFTPRAAIVAPEPTPQ